MRYEIINTMKGGYILYNSEDSPYTLWLGSMCLSQSNYLSPHINICLNKTTFNYHNETSPLFKQSSDCIKRFYVLQMSYSN